MLVDEKRKKISHNLLLFVCHPVFTPLSPRSQGIGSYWWQTVRRFIVVNVYDVDGHAFFIGVLQASFSCHQRMAIYADGKILTRNSRASFEDVHCSEFLPLAVNFTIPKTTKLITIRAETSQDAAKIIGSFTDGVVTDSQWKCSSNDVSDWFLPQFDDLCWTPAHELSATDHSGATDEQQVVGVLPSAKWINTGDLSPIIICRLHRKVT